uniref:Uncharacterized protein n=1 Tax=Avena sativa TaxID=4498 RepID=A0ACD5T7V5_AVESA
MSDRLKRKVIVSSSRDSGSVKCKIPLETARDRGKWLHFSGVRNLALSGAGIVDGRGQQWWARAAQSAPKALHFEDCRDISVKGVTVQDSQREHLVFTRCSDVEASYLRVTSPEHSPGTVGVLLVSSVNVHVMDDLFSVGGDCVSIVGNCTDVRLRAISCGPGHGISIGGLGENGSLHKIEKIKTDTMFISNTKYGVRVKTYEGGCGTARKVKFAQIVMRNVSNPIIIDQHYSASNRETPCGTTGASAVAVGEIDYTDITGTSATEQAVTFACSDAMPCRHLSLTGVNLTRVGGGNASAYCHQAFGRNVGDVVPESCLGEEDFMQSPTPGRALQGDADS